MKKEIITWYKGLAFTVSESVAKKLGIPNNYRIKTEKELWNIIAANSIEGIKICNMAIEADEISN